MKGGGGKGGNMAVNIYVGLENGEITCVHDPAYMRTRDHQGEKHPDKHLVWHNDNGESFKLHFKTDSPFESGALEVEGRRRIKEKVKDHTIKVEYEYGVTVIDSSGQQYTVDPGLIIEP
jgi:hypothetical protein